MNTQDTAKDKPGMYQPDYRIRDNAPVIAFGSSSAPLSPDACPTCRNLAVDCLCESERAS
jgi:hypothetical protein